MATSKDVRLPARPHAEALRRHGDLRDVRDATCESCGYTWTAPVVGRCPKCKGPALLGESYLIGAPRV